jgi:hypothetical protein
MPRERRNAETDGSYQALDHVANWVRFADVKATVLTAALGVPVTMLAANASNVISAGRTSEVTAVVLGAMAIVAASSFAFTLGWLVNAIAPRRQTTGTLNRFSWPTLTYASREELRSHAGATPAHQDAWDQVLTLAQVAEQKFDATRYAAAGFVVFAASAICCVVGAAFVTELFGG